MRVHVQNTYTLYERMIHSSWGRRCLVKHRKPWWSCVCRLSIILLRKLAIYCDYLWYILHATKFYVPGLRYSEKIVKPNVPLCSAQGTLQYVAAPLLVPARGSSLRWLLDRVWANLISTHMYDTFSTYTVCREVLAFIIYVP